VKLVKKLFQFHLVGFANAGMAEKTLNQLLQRCSFIRVIGKHDVRCVSEHVFILILGNFSEVALREACHYCGSVDCERSCESQVGGLEPEEEARLLFNAAVNGVESFLLALACEGIRVDGPEFHRALQTVMDKLEQRYK